MICKQLGWVGLGGTMLPVHESNVLPAAKHLRKLRLAKLHCNSFCQITTMWKYYLVHGTCYLSIQ